MQLLNSLVLRGEEKLVYQFVHCRILRFFIFLKSINALQCLRDLSEYVSVLPVDKQVIRQALYSGFSDYEDAVQYYSALQDSSIDAIATRNTKDFALSKLPVLLPGEYLE